MATFEDQSDPLFAAYGDAFYLAYTNTFTIADRDSDTIRLTATQFRRNVTSDNDLKAYLSYARTRARGMNWTMQYSIVLHIAIN